MPQSSKGKAAVGLRPALVALQGGSRLHRPAPVSNNQMDAGAADRLARAVHHPSRDDDTGLLERAAHPGRRAEEEQFEGHVRLLRGYSTTTSRSWARTSKGPACSSAMAFSVRPFSS